MIKSWRHKGLRLFFETGKKTGIKTEHTKRLKIILQRLNAAIRPEDMNTPGMQFHKLSGEFSGFYAVSVSGNWRVIFGFDRGNAENVHYLDYH